MRVELSNDLVIVDTECGFQISKVRVAGKDSKEPGKQYDVGFSWHHSLLDAAKRALELVAKKDSDSIQNINRLIKVINRSTDRIAEAIEGSDHAERSSN